jgi:hypothetical protein
MVVRAEEKALPSDGGNSINTSDMRFSRWDEPVDITAPGNDQIDRTPAFDEAQIASAPFNVLAPKTLAPELKLLSAEFYDGKAADGECPSVSLHYADPVEEQRGMAEEDYYPKSLDIDVSAASCTADDAMKASDGFPGEAKTEPFTAGPYKGTIVRHDGSDFGPSMNITLVVDGTELSVSANIPEAQVISALSSLVKFDMSSQPVWIDPTG